MKVVFEHYHHGNGRPRHSVVQEARAAGALGIHMEFADVPPAEAGFPLIRGATVCRILDDSGAELAKGYAFCSMNDQFCKRTGRMIAEGRARHALEIKSAYAGAEVIGNEEDWAPPSAGAPLERIAEGGALESQRAKEWSASWSVPRMLP